MHGPDPRPEAPARAGARRGAARAAAAVALAVAIAVWPATGALAEGEPPVSVKAAPLKVAAGDQGTLLVTVAIEKNFALVAPPPPTKYASTMSLILSAGEGLAPLAPVYPGAKPVTEEDGTTYGTYEGQITVKVPVKVAPGTPAGTKTLKGKLRYQPLKFGQFHKTAVLPVEFTVEVTAAKKGKAEPKPKPAEPAKPAGAPQPGGPSTRR